MINVLAGCAVSEGIRGLWQWGIEGGVDTYQHIVKLVRAVAPHAVENTVPLAEHPHCFVRVVALRHTRPVLAFPARLRAPELNLHVFRLPRVCVDICLREGYRAAVEVGSWRYTHHLEEGGREIRVRGGDVCYDVLRHVRAADQEGDVDVCFEGAFLAGLQAVLADVVAVVGAEDDIGVV